MKRTAKAAAAAALILFFGAVSSFAAPAAPVPVRSALPGARREPQKTHAVTSAQDLPSAEKDPDAQTAETAGKAAPEKTGESASVREPVPYWLWHEDGEPGESVKALKQYLQYSAPLRLTRKDPQSAELIETAPQLAYLYVDLLSGREAGWQADLPLYAASLAKIPYLFAVLTEIEAFEAQARGRDENGGVVFGPGEEKYDLDAAWTYDPASMYVFGSGEIQKEKPGFTLTWRKLFEFAVLYSDNIAFSQISARFGYESYDALAQRLGVTAPREEFMRYSARDLAKFLAEIYRGVSDGSEYALWLKDLMTKSMFGSLVAAHYPAGTVAHKYGWDVNAFHDMAIVFDERPYLLVILTDYDDGSPAAFSVFRELVGLTKLIHAESGERTGG